MRRTIISMAVGIMLPFSASYADIASDVEAGLSPAQIVANAQAEGLTVDQIMQQIASADAALIDAIVTAAIDAGMNAGAVVNAATAAGADRVAMEQVAILAGADPSEVGEATAAGGPQGQGRGLGIAPGQTGNPVSPPPFGSNGGGGGGGNPSPT
ncbi:hypothetical protein [Neptuniibacter sp. QD34_54]|uniref:hypothetical protein n=1 Tax=Neptuniibacter sp. QD34_54 TaxID=3398208 RepID=UPI0039F4D5B7